MIPEKSRPKVSVIIPVYNEEKYLDQCLGSICNQTLSEIEIICVDDGSTDASLQILEKFAKQDSRFKVLKQCNQYAGKARNLGMQIAEGKYLCFLDADDFFSLELLEKMYLAAEQYHSEIVICNARYYNDKTGEITERNIPHEKQFLPSNSKIFNRNVIPEGLFQITNGWAWDKLFLTEFIKKERFQFAGSRTANDGFFVYMALALADRITKVDEYLVTQRIQNSNSLANTRNKSWRCGFDMLCDIRKGLRERNLYVQLERTFLNFALKYIAWSYNSMEEWEGKERIYSFVHEGKMQLPITEHPAEYYYYPEEYELYRQMERVFFGNYAAVLLSQKDVEIKRLLEGQRQLTETINAKRWLFPFSQVKQQSNIVLYGAGKVGQDYYRQIMDSQYCKVVLWMDRNFEDTANRDQNVACGWMKELQTASFDKIVLALKRKKDMEEATELILSQGVSKKQIIWKV